MKCPRCQAENTAAQKFCGACGAPLAQARAKFESPKSYTLAEELGMRPLVARCRLGLGEFHRRTGRRQRAQEQTSPRRRPCSAR